MADLQRFVSACKRAATSFGLTVTWISIAERLVLAEEPSSRVLQNLDAQFESAVRTALICATSRPARLVFLLNETGTPKPAEGLNHGVFRQRIWSSNFIASCEIGRPLEESISRDSDDAVVVWIDDLTRRERDQNPYSSRAKAFLYRHCPVLLDVFRQRRTVKINQLALAKMVSLRQGKERVYYPHPAGSGSDFRPAVLFCLYWLDHGGAEAFAIQSMAMARRAGYEVIVACDEAGRHRLLDKAAAYADAIYLIGSFGSHISKESAYLRILRRHRPAVIHIHHSWTMYRLLPVVRTLGLTRGVVDTLHILENRFLGFVGEASLYSEYIDHHHVISEQLAGLLTTTAHVDPHRIRLGKLHDLSKTFRPAPNKWDKVQPIRIAFIGRYSQQKRPFLFVEIARRLQRRYGPDRFLFQAVGDGPLRPPTEDLARYSRLGENFVFLPGSAPVQDVLAAAHVLVIPSDNEGLTLVAFEAIRAGCVVLACDVGAQRELVLDDLLLPTASYGCVRKAVSLIGQLTEGKVQIDDLLQRQERKLDSNLETETGSQACLSIYQQIIGSGGRDVHTA